jgi:D-glycero-D-manno-heptose 1,7-bisphosphate phosphatase
MGNQSSIPKSLQIIKGVTILERQLNFFKSQGFSQFLLLLGNQSEQIKPHVQGLTVKMQIKIDCIEESYPLGTGGALLNSISKLHDEFILIHGDLFLNTNMNELKVALKNSENKMAFMFHPSHHPEDSDLLKISQNRIVEKILVKPRIKGYYRNRGNAGCYAIKREILEKYVNENPEIFVIDLDRELLPKLIALGHKAVGIRNRGFIRDCGTPERLDYINANWDQIEKFQQYRPAVFIDRDGTLNKLNGFITKFEQLDIFEDVPYFISEINKIGFWLIVVTNQPSIARGELSTEMLDSFHAKIESDVSKVGAIIDEFYFCPHHPESGHAGEITSLKIDCNCRKPNTGLIDQAMQDFQIDISKSWMIGDTWRDFELARKRNLKFIQIYQNENDRIKNIDSAKTLTDALKYIKQEVLNQ